MLNEVEEFQSYTEPPVYKADSKRDTTYMGRFSMDMILDFNGLARVVNTGPRAPRARELSASMPGK